MGKHSEEPEYSSDLCLSLTRTEPPLGEQTQAFLPVLGTGCTIRAVQPFCLREARKALGGGSCEFHRDCPRLTSICLLVPCLFFFPRGSVPRGPATMLCGRGLCGAANCPGDVTKLYNQTELPSFASSPLFPAILFLLVSNSLFPPFPEPRCHLG